MPSSKNVWRIVLLLLALTAAIRPIARIGLSALIGYDENIFADLIHLNSFRASKFAGFRLAHRVATARSNDAPLSARLKSAPTLTHHITVDARTEVTRGWAHKSADVEAGSVEGSYHVTETPNVKVAETNEVSTTVVLGEYHTIEFLSGSDAYTIVDWKNDIHESQSAWNYVS
jgi:hypothetical protein